MQSIQSLDPFACFCGVGGPKMEKLGFQSFVSIEKLSVLGFFEVFKRLPFFLQLKNDVVKDIKQKNPDKIILVDYPGFNLRLAQTIKKSIKTPIIYYISPQLWAWKEKRISYIKKYVDSMIVLFPFEKSWYRRRGVEAHYFGHPLYEIYGGFSEKFKETRKKNAIALFPGSRQQEIQKHIPLFKEVIVELKKLSSDLFFVVRLADGVCLNVEEELGLKRNYSIEKNSSLRAFSLSSFAIVASGTATLEGAFSKTPLVVIYKTSWLSWVLAKCFLNVPFVSIVNILNKKKLVEEFLQNKANPQVIAKHVIKNLSLPSPFDYDKILEPLSQKNVYQNTAKHIINIKL